MTIAGIACLTIAMAGIITLINGEPFDWLTGAIVATLASASLGGLWFTLGLGLRRRIPQGD